MEGDEDEDEGKEGKEGGKGGGGEREEESTGHGMGLADSIADVIRARRDASGEGEMGLADIMRARREAREAEALAREELQAVNVKF